MKPLLLLIVALMLDACATLPPSHNATTPDGSYRYVLRGESKLTVVFEAGLGDGMSSWSGLISALPRGVRVFAYDRGGYGGSRASVKSRDGLQIVRELHGLLKTEDVRPPYLLVGHSLGGTYMELFARTYPAEVAGVVLIDARHADFTERCRQAGAVGCDPPALLTYIMPGAARAEFAAMDKTITQMHNAGPFPPVPLAVLTGTKKIFEGPVFSRVWMETQHDLVKLSPQGRHEICGSCGHYVHHDNRDLVVKSIKEIIASVQK